MRKNWGVSLVNRFSFGALKGQRLKGFFNDEQYIQSHSAPEYKIRVRIFKPEGATQRLPAMLYLHGGGYLIGVPEQSFPFYKDIMRRREIAIIAPDYRLSVKHPYPAGFNDCYDTLLWMKENADELGIDPDKFIIAGHSAGGGLVVALSLKARDTKDVQIAFQMPIYPMIDHRMITESARNMVGVPVWDSRTNRFAWEHYLKDLQDKEIPIYASPALNEDCGGLPPTISYVGELEPFKDETIAYIESLKAAGVPVLFQYFEGAFHGFETVAAKTRIGKEGNAFQIDAFAEYFDRYIN